MMGRILYCFLLIIFSGQSWVLAVTPEGDNYRYDGSYVATAAQNYDYDAALNLCASGVQHPFESIDIKAQGGSSLALLSDFIVTKGTNPAISTRKTDA